LACEKVSIPWSTGAASTGTSALTSAAADFFFPLSFFAIGGGQSEVQVAVTTLAKQCYGKWRSGRLIATMHTTLVLMSFLRGISMAKHGAWGYWNAFYHYHHRNRVSEVVLRIHTE